MTGIEQTFSVLYYGTDLSVPVLTGIAGTQHELDYTEARDAGVRRVNNGAAVSKIRLE